MLMDTLMTLAQGSEGDSDIFTLRNAILFGAIIVIVVAYKIYRSKQMG
jgi:hypothetical protein